MFTALKTIVY